ncbi:hypothetical protein [Aeromonas dhakensis]|uniref:hypothetical protein n=1 Tax=Aeromonas dhakensis TaxID=196024 RepID=UPI003D6BAD93
MAIDQNGTIRCAVTGGSLFIAPDSIIDHSNPDSAGQLNSTYQPAKHQVTFSKSAQGLLE